MMARKMNGCAAFLSSRLWPFRPTGSGNGGSTPKPPEYLAKSKAMGLIGLATCGLRPWQATVPAARRDGGGFALRRGG